jgi:hypothetical protein
MSLAEEIYQRVQRLPEDKALEVLDFIGYLEMKYGLSYSSAQDRDQAFISRIQENSEDEVWKDLLFARSRSQ